MLSKGHTVSLQGPAFLAFIDQIPSSLPRSSNTPLKTPNRLLDS
jgi:hypothetical protein